LVGQTPKATNQNDEINGRGVPHHTGVVARTLAHSSVPGAR